VVWGKAYLRNKWHLDPSNRLATIVTRQTHAHRQTTVDSIVQTVLQTFAQKFGLKNATMYLVAWLGPDPLEELTTQIESAFRKKVIKMLHRHFVYVGKTLTDLQILGCELHQNAFGSRALPRPAGGAIALSQIP